MINVVPIYLLIDRNANRIIRSGISEKNKKKMITIRKHVKFNYLMRKNIK